VYNGQKLIKLVKTNITESVSNTIPKVPGIILVKYNVAIMPAIKIRIILSAAPMFFFI
jgi:hypothetical protein